MQWRLWNGGTARVLFWGDPDYARRFAESTHLYDGDGFEVNEPLGTKMEAQPHDAKPFDLLIPSTAITNTNSSVTGTFTRFLAASATTRIPPPKCGNGSLSGVLERRRRPLVERGLAPGQLDSAADRRFVLSLQRLSDDPRLGGEATARRPAGCMPKPRGATSSSSLVSTTKLECSLKV